MLHTLFCNYDLNFTVISIKYSGVSIKQTFQSFETYLTLNVKNTSVWSISAYYNFSKNFF